ncbi:MAG: HAD-IC family P-type ATPase, partial [Chloroflexi bacterium]|nr:HAD-IC family P-type ATPase [Chloroflexota bacterium]
VAVETLGAATVICSDKTGTLTLNQMTVRRVFVDGQLIEVSGEGYQPIGDFRADGRAVDPLALSPLALHLKIGALCNDALLSREEKCCDVLGDPTEGALVVLAAKAGMDKERLESVYPRLGEIPFQSEKQFMATLHPRDGGRVAYVKGAPERLLALSSHVLTAGGVIPLEPVKAQEIARANASLAGEALRVIATAYVEMPTGNGGLDETHIQGTLVFVGLSGMDDPPRPEAFRAVKLCQQAGIKVVMITGDHKLTAESVARQLELPAGETVSGPEVQGMSDDELSRRIEGISVFARIEPLHKLRIVTAFKSRGHVVAMTGDGVNDAPALKAADIGVAMGVTGTDVAKEAGDMILADDDFATVVAAVEEGRATFNRLRGAVFFLLSSNLGELLALILSVSFFGAAPLLAVQILWVNLVTDGASGVPLGLEPKSGDELRQPPRHPGVGLIFPGLLLRTFYMSAFMGLGVFLVFGWAMTRSGAEEARTVAFCAMVAFEWGKAFNARSDEHTIFALGPLRNRWLVASTALALLLQLAVVYLPPLQAAFGTVSLGAGEWGVVVLAGAALFSIEEARKALFPRLFALGKWKPVSWTSGTRR